ncbi:MAG: hypothetical protein WCP87_00325 [Atribacterota bacterium]|nr:hypothetical protein [Candidatus Atribacteria bacterium]
MLRRFPFMCILLIGFLWWGYAVPPVFANNTIQFPTLNLPTPTPATPVPSPQPSVLPFQNLLNQPTPNPSPINLLNQPPQLSWGTFDVYNEFGAYDKLMIGLVVDYPRNWVTSVDTYNRLVSFSEDQSGMVSFIILPSCQGSWRDAQSFFSDIAPYLSQKFSNLGIISQDVGVDPDVKGIDVNSTYYKADLQGGFQGQSMLLHVEVGVYSVQTTATAFYSVGGAIICYAPRDVFPQKLQTIFGRMISSIVKTMKTTKKKE